jgi:hypothetical protein
MITGVPVAGGENWQIPGYEARNPAVELRDHGISVRHRQTAPGEEIILHVHQYEGVAWTWRWDIGDSGRHGSTWLRRVTVLPLSL